MDPRAEPLSLPAAYGRTKTRRDWSTVRTRLETAKAYWLATARPDGRPHVVAVDGVWIDEVFFYGGSPDSVHRRAAEQNPSAVLHLADPYDVVIVEGEVRPAAPTIELGERLAAATNEKYAASGYRTDAGSFSDSLALRPRRVLAWSKFPTDATRFVFDDG
jgi:hypothetical protein